MNDQHPNRRRDALLRRALVPKGYRPTTDADIERMLDTIGEVPIDAEKLQRMLEKVNGRVPLFPDRTVTAPVWTSELNEQEQEMYALHRSKNKPLPPDLAAKVKALEERAAERPHPDGEAPRA